ncbi:MAG: hypothetical protein ABEJ23_04780 [Haloarculaceae archaeon]
MASERVECGRCGATFDTENDLIAHSIDAHAGEWGSVDGHDRTATDERAADGLDGETADRLLRLLEERATSTETVLVQYGQRFLLIVGLAVLGIAVVLSYLHLADLLGTAAYMFSLGLLFGLSLSYLQAFVQSARR